MMKKLIRNFAIIAHIDHGKSTLADRLLEYTGTISGREKVDQFLDSMELERERGITIKAQTVRLNYTARDGNLYRLNLIDTPGHVDFSYEVSRSLAACEGALLIVDATQGVEAQTLSNVYQAIDQGLEIIPAINKIDLPNADPERVKNEIEDIIGLETENLVLTSAKTGKGTHEILQKIVDVIPPPGGHDSEPLKALVVDSWFDTYQGVVTLIRVFDGKLVVGDKMVLMSTGRGFEVTKLGYFGPYPTDVKELLAGEVGFFIAGIKNVGEVNVGDTVTVDKYRAIYPLPGFKRVKPMVFAGVYPVNSDDYPSLKDAINKLRLNDSSFTSDPETSNALGFGFRCGFLGLLHMEIVQERLEREFDIELITTAPTVRYRVVKKNAQIIEIDSPSQLPPAAETDYMEEPIITATIHLPAEYLGQILKLCEDKRGIQKELKFVTGNRVILTYDLPLNEIVLDFYDRLKTLSRGYASLDYEFAGYQKSDLVLLDILINKEKVDALSTIVHRQKSYRRGKELGQKLKELIPRQLFDIIIQAAVGSKVIARETIKAMRKNVLGKCYGGDVTRKRKLLERQKEGKKRMKQVGTVEIPQEAFLAILMIKE
ncbi:MAG: elongation factor 4 [Deltaproteobacteria bacterium]|nr:elongation factor 4 [Deltaproteobacteria bacterium]